MDVLLSLLQQPKRGCYFNASLTRGGVEELGVNRLCCRVASKTDVVLAAVLKREAVLAIAQFRSNRDYKVFQL